MVSVLVSLLTSTLRIWTVLFMLFCINAIFSCRTSSSLYDKETSNADESQLQGFLDKDGTYHLKLALIDGGQLYRFEVCTSEDVPLQCTPAFLSNTEEDVTFSIEIISLHTMHQHIKDGYQSVSKRWQNYLTAMDEDTKLALMRIGLAGSTVIGAAGAVIYARGIAQRKTPPDLRVPIRFSDNGYKETLHPHFLNRLRSDGYTQKIMRESFENATNNPFAIPKIFKQYIKREGSIQNVIAPKHWEQFIRYVADEQGIEATAMNIIDYSKKHYNQAYKHYLNFVKYHGVSLKFLSFANGMPKSIAPLMRNKNTRIIAGIILITSFFLGNDSHAASITPSSSSTEIHLSYEQKASYAKVLEQGDLPVLVDSFATLFATDDRVNTVVDSVVALLTPLGIYFQMMSEEMGTIRPEKYCYPSPEGAICSQIEEKSP